MPQLQWCQGTHIALVHGTEAPLQERRVAETAARSIRERGVRGEVFTDEAFDSNGEWDLTIRIGTSESYPSLAREFEIRDRMRPTSHLLAGSESSRGMTCLDDAGRHCGAIIAEDVSGLWSGVGRFLRHMMWLNAEFACPAWSDEFRPAMKLRGEVISSHAVSNTYLNWEIDEWRRYIEDMALWGMNLFYTIPLHFADWLGMDPWSDPPVFASQEQRDAFERHWSIQSRVSEIVRDMGLFFGVWMPSNDPPMALHRDEWDRGWKEYVCPSIPDAREAILRGREEYARRLPHLDILFVPSADDGGCWCSDCTPWSETYLGLLRDQYDIVRRYHPDVQVMLSNQALTHTENTVLCAALAGMDDTSWIAGVAYAPGSNELFRHARLTEEWSRFDRPDLGTEVISLKDFRRHLPSDIDLYLYPDITHSLRCQYPIWETDPIVGHTYHRDPTFFRPAFYHDMYQKTAPFCDGSFPYSEGMYDNFNQVLWLELGNDPHRAAHEIVFDYWRWHVGDAAAPSASAATDALEQAWLEDITTTTEIDRAVRNTFEMFQHVPRGREQGNWRADILRLRSLTDRWLRDRLRHASEAEQRIIEHLTTIDAKCDDVDADDQVRAVQSALRQAADMTRQSISEISPTPDEAEIRLLVDRVRREGLEVPAIERIGLAAGNLPWIARTLDEAAASRGIDDMQSAMLDITDYERGVLYIDCGHPRRDTQRLNGRTFITLDLTDTTVRPSQTWVAMSYGEDEPLSYRIEGLDLEREYDVELTYFTPDYLLRWCYSGEQRLEASGVELHGPMKMPHTIPQRTVCRLPVECYRQGETVLRFIPSGNSVAAMVSEIWVRERS
jgi:hypothetical protein